MRADVSILEAESRAHGLPSVRVAAPRRDRLETRVGIASFSAHTCFGNLRETWERLLRGDVIDDHARLTDRGATGRALALARCACAGLDARHGLDADAAIIVGTSKGSVEDWFNPTSDNVEGALSATGLGDIAAALAAQYRTCGPVLTLSAACASGLHALIRGAMMIRSGEVRQAMIVAAEASVHPLFLGSFQRLGILAKPGAGCRPFDQRRTGFYMSEAASAVLLEALNDEEDDDDSGADGGARRVVVDRFALGGDATHVTGTDPDARLLKHLLQRVIDGRQVDLVHAHGTGTVANDAIELAAIESALAGGVRPRAVLYAHKAGLGHSLGASGLLSVVLNCMCHANGIVPPNARTDRPLPAGRVTISNVPVTRTVRRSLAIAAGFGGPTAVVSLVGR